MNTTRILDRLLDKHENRYELVLKVAQRAKQIKNETREQQKVTNAVIQALQMVAAEGDGTILISPSGSIYRPY
ncbi:MAG: DNA-directed RNA polymerase subunit omega [Candidatus Obscuribacterales bacterium]|nr:DNA-directed RNA polymerase subunit omega [Candidatus Obscuribacterales bacterium]